MNKVNTIVLRILQDVFAAKLPQTELEDSMDLYQDLHMEPLNLLELLLTLSAVFDLRITKNDALKLRKIGDINCFIENAVSAQDIPAAVSRLEKMTYVHAFSAIAWKIGIISNEIVDTLEEAFSMKVGDRSVDISGIPLTALYLMQNLEGGCKANCAFCVQSRDSSRERKEKMLLDLKLCRLPMPTLARHIRGGMMGKCGIERICLQTVFNPKTVDNLLSLVSSLNSVISVPITACCIPISKESMVRLKEAGLDMITINYEVATPELFYELRGPGRKGPYTWEGTTEAIAHALDVFGDYKVGSHIQVGFGETQRDVLARIQELKNKKVRVSLFAFKPLPGTALQNRKDRVSYGDYHRIQLGSYLIQNGRCEFDDFSFDADGRIVDYGIKEGELRELILSGIPFMNRGCPGCNRVFFDNLPGERFYSYPRKPTAAEIACIAGEILSIKDNVGVPLSASNSATV
jgi:lipoyl synthase